ncbi:PD-(D/E)XK nuclease family protein [Bacteroides neonati]|uniref:PD-(D/E)XK nuclease family protein n=1 Tax=Bacteroides neonati TaxID=1347393 RepID=UPI0004BAF0CF|nr:PD-(D/E)XK nuclease family protein [Bacteroides neonati]
MKTDKDNLACDMCLVDKITGVSIDLEKQKFLGVNSLLKTFIAKVEEEKTKLPYHINIIDMIGANENAHSKILEHLLKQSNKERFEILESLLDYIVSNTPDFKLNVSSPSITAEKQRIDVLVLDKEYALIFENKIHNAIDQERQLSRYIDKVTELGYKKEQIYILYLSRDDGKSPNDDSWGKYKDLFENRYIRLTYRNHILPWLRDFLLPNIRIKDVYLKSCVEQYIDHLEGLFSLRNIQKNMNKELKKQISEVLGLGVSPEQNHFILDEKIKEVNAIRDQLAIMQSENERECWAEWSKRLKIDFPDLESMNYIDDRNYPKIGVKLSWNNIPFSVLIEKDNNSNTIYYGIGRHYSSENIIDELKAHMTSILDGFKANEWWYSWKYTSFEDGYRDLSNYIKEVVRHVDDCK